MFSVIYSQYSWYYCNCFYYKIYLAADMERYLKMCIMLQRSILIDKNTLIVGNHIARVFVESMTFSQELLTSQYSYPITYIIMWYFYITFNSSAWMQKCLIGYCFKYKDRPFCLKTDAMFGNFLDCRKCSLNFKLCCWRAWWIWTITTRKIWKRIWDKIGFKTVRTFPLHFAIWYGFLCISYAVYILGGV